MLVLFLTACPGGSNATLTCEEALTPAQVAGCFAGPDLPEATGGQGPGDWEGEVAEVAEGAFPAACSVAVADAPQGTGWAVRLVADGGDVWAGIETPGATMPGIGETVRVRTYRAAPTFGPTLATVEVSAGGVIIGYVGEAGTPDDLAPLGVELAIGEPVCLTQDGCGDWRGYGLEVSVGAAQGLGVPYGTTGTIGTFQVTNADLREQVGEGASCPDWFVASARVGIGR